jgi:hypothetical protein
MVGVVLFEAVRAIVHGQVDLDAGMQALLDDCAWRLPDPVWADLRSLDWKRDETRLQAWLRDVLTKEPPPPSCAALYFGLADWEDPEGEGYDAVCRLSIGGSDHFDPEDADFEWAVHLPYWPSDRLADSEVLKAISRSMRQTSDDMCMLGMNVLCQGYAGLVLKRLLPQVTELALHGRDTRGVAFGFDEGDALLLGVLARSGWT